MLNQNLLNPIQPHVGGMAQLTVDFSHPGSTRKEDLVALGARFGLHETDMTDRTIDRLWLM